MPISERKLAANRANAKRSTGPRTAAGKQTAAFNRLVHGLRARSVVLPGEDPDDYRRFGVRLFDDLAPQGILEGELVMEIVNLSWKLRRVPGVETTMLVETHGKDQPPLPPLRVICAMLKAKSGWDSSPNSPLWVVDRYASRLERARASALRLLLTLQKRRQREDPRWADAEEPDDVAGGDEDNDVARPNEATATPGDEAAQTTASATDA